MLKPAREYSVPFKERALSWGPASLTALAAGKGFTEASFYKHFYISGLGAEALAARAPGSGLSVLRTHRIVLPYFHLSRAAAVSSWSHGVARLLHRLSDWVQVFAPFSRSLIIRGIGYRLYPLISTSSDDVYRRSRYVYLRAGHSYPTFCGVPNDVGLKTYKRERKLLVYGYNEALVGVFADRLFYYRPPNAFTGRGIRFKAVRYKRKPGKRAQKGRGF